MHEFHWTSLRFSDCFTHLYKVVRIFIPHLHLDTSPTLLSGYTLRASSRARLAKLQWGKWMSFEESFEVKLPIYSQMQQPWWEQAKKIKMREKVMSRNNLFFQCFVDVEGWKVGLLSRVAKAAGGGTSDEKSKIWTPLWPEAAWEVRMLKTPHVWSTFGSWVVQSGRCCTEKCLSTLGK